MFVFLVTDFSRFADIFLGSEGLSDREIISSWQTAGSYLIPALRAHCKRVLLLCDATRAPQK